MKVASLTGRHRRPSVLSDRFFRTLNEGRDPDYIDLDGRFRAEPLLLIDNQESATPSGEAIIFTLLNVPQRG
ncbi:hypothetical protein O181_026327 [Austropuccinia psidii MF-1]|uniref:Uncharacterized protein n=1 Tax=Austropuccinia psidii MF-1 TaxID=1389203 RepID=A0A9Q3H0P4_9BASI|nr:hypothetical protein [Austropuccinia psidii MF-1]